MEDEALFALARGGLSGAELERVERHLQDCADCRAVLAAAAEPDPRSAPARIARYEIAALLGAGSSGVVYRAFDPQLQRAVAVKLLRPELHGSSPEQSERLRREAQAMARLSDPHVVAVYDVGLHEGTVYLVMEYIDGATLSEWLRAERRSVADILRVFGDAGQGLLAAHQKGLVHRDFKPENVLVARDGRAKVTDFGLARESESWQGQPRADPRGNTALYTFTRGLVGTPAYMAPELFEGGSASPQSDQFAFSVALFAALFGRHPFKAGEGIALSELVTRVRASALQKPALENAEQERLLGVLRQGLAASPEGRFADMQVLLSQLGKPSRKRGRALLLATLPLLLLFLGIALARSRERPRSAVPTSSVVGLASSVPPPPEVPQLVAPLPAPSKTAAAPKPLGSERRRAPKPSEVRYKDWLKDPF